MMEHYRKNNHFTKVNKWTIIIFQDVIIAVPSPSLISQPFERHSTVATRFSNSKTNYTIFPEDFVYTENREKALKNHELFIEPAKNLRSSRDRLFQN